MQEREVLCWIEIEEMKNVEGGIEKGKKGSKNYKELIDKSYKLIN